MFSTLMYRLAVALMLVVVTACFICFQGCSQNSQGSSLAGSWNYQEVKRVKSPDSRIEAVILTGDAGATTATETFVLLVPTGTPIETNKAPSDVIFTADHLKGFQVFWKNTQLLVLQYDEARISNFNNLYDVSDGKQYYPIETRLAPTSQDFSVPLNDRATFPVK